MPRGGAGWSGVVALTFVWGSQVVYGVRMDRRRRSEMIDGLVIIVCVGGAIAYTLYAFLA